MLKDTIVPVADAVALRVPETAVPDTNAVLKDTIVPVASLEFRVDVTGSVAFRPCMKNPSATG